MKKIILPIATVVIVAGLLGACTNKEMGTTGGAVLGGAIGYGVSHNAVGAAVGAVGGGILGNTLSH